MKQFSEMGFIELGEAYEQELLVLGSEPNPAMTGSEYVKEHLVAAQNMVGILTAFTSIALRMDQDREYANQLEQELYRHEAQKSQG